MTNKPMLNRTFIHIPSVGYRTERALWCCGIRTWEEALHSDSAPRGFAGERWGRVRQTVLDSRRRLAAGDHRYFAQMLRPRDHWRSFADFRKRIGYLDIETSGLNQWDDVTVVGIYDGVRTHTYVAGDNMDRLAEDIGDYALLVTFNGALFDLPFLRRRFGSIFDQLHIDLRFALRKLGYRGGLKSIERQVGIDRSGEIADIRGEDAVMLWHEYQNGSQEALRLLVEYNRADVVNLEYLAESAYGRLRERALEGIEE